MDRYFINLKSKMSDSKCIILLSEKSSGSSAFQNLLAKFSVVKNVSKTRHYENETLYWTKAASILDLPQLNMIDSEVPIERKKAKKDLVTLLRDNLENYSPPADDKELIFGGWKLLCEKYRPIFLEKSPHHLVQWSAIELIIECIKEFKEIDFLLIGLIRNPMDTIYSQFKRWKARPEQLQHQWLVAYQNLLKLKDIMGEQMVVVRYEDMVTSLRYLKPVFDFCDVKISEAEQDYLHPKSILKWKGDHLYGFSLSDEVITLAQSFGYHKKDLTNKRFMLWPVYRELSRAAYKSTLPLKITILKCLKILGH